MTDEQAALSRRAVACRGWRWMPGMQTDSKFARVVTVDIDSGVACAAEEGASEDDCYAVWLDGVPVLPDLTDAATLGCLLALVREAWAAPRALVRLSANGKSFHVFDVDRVTTGGNWAAFLCGDHRIQTEAEALVAALESAP